MDVFLFRQLLHDKVIDDVTFKRIETFESNRPVSVHKDLLTLLYAGIFLLITGLGIVVYKNLESIGHVAIVISIVVGCAACFVYCFKKSARYSYQKVESPNVWSDYVLLLGCGLMLTLVAYLQFQFQVFGNRWGLATFVPMVLLFFAAYYFDHLGVLSMAITNLGTWVGITVTPTRLLQGNNFEEHRLIYSGVGLGIVLIAAALASRFSNTKAHFSFTYKNFGANLLFVSLLTGLFVYSHTYLVWFLALAAVSYYQFVQAVKEHSFYFLVITTIYFYVGISYVIIRFFVEADIDDTSIYLSLIYLIATCIALVAFLMRYNKILKTNAGIS